MKLSAASRLLEAPCAVNRQQDHHHQNNTAAQRRNLVDKVQKLEQAFSILPEDTPSPVRRGIKDNISTTNKSIIACKPIGAQVDDAKAVLE